MQKLSAKKWLISCISVFLACLVVLMAVAYLFDPFIQYHMWPGKKIIADRYVLGGLIKNYDYDTTIIGSSMAQNFNVDMFRSAWGCKPVKLVYSGLTHNHVLTLYRMTQRKGKAKRFIINVDLHTFGRSGDPNNSVEVFPHYLYDFNLFNDYRYLLGYIVWFEYIPANLAVNLAHYFEIEPLIKRFGNVANIDDIGNWSKKYTSFGEDTVKQYYLSRDGVSDINLDRLEERMTREIDLYLETIRQDLRPETQITFVFPPYSALYWHTTKKNGYMDQFLRTKLYFVSQAEQIQGVDIVDVQDFIEITDLNYYKDSTHYGPYLQDKMTEAILSGTHRVNSETVLDTERNLRVLVTLFESANQEWLPD